MAARISYRLVASMRSLSLVGGSLLVLLHASCSSALSSERPGVLVPQGVGTFTFTSPNGPHPEIAIDIWYYRPDPSDGEAPILVVVPGRGRNAEEYRDDWLPHARRENVMLLVPELPADVYPNAEYNLGNLVDSSGEAVPSRERTFSVVEDLYDQVRSELDGNQPGYYLYGHSAGAQFVHRFMLFTEHTNVLHAVSANAGWYTVPDTDVAYPHGLADGPLATTEDDIARMAAAPLTVLLGAEDTDPDASGLRRDEASMAQGATRLDRGFHFFQQGRQAAQELDVPFAWTVEVVDGVAHANAAMAEAASTVLFG